MAKQTYNPEHYGAQCSICPLRGQTYVPPTGPLDADIVVVGEAPGFKEVQQQKPFVGPSGIKLDALLYFAKMKRDRIWITNSILCRPEVPGLDGVEKYDVKKYVAWIRKENALKKRAAKLANKDPEVIASPFDCCAGRLWGELGHFEKLAKERGQPNGAVVVPLGNFALKAIAGREGIMKMRGHPLTIDMADPHRPDSDRLQELIGDAKIYPTAVAVEQDEEAMP